MPRRASIRTAVALIAIIFTFAVARADGASYDVRLISGTLSPAAEMSVSERQAVRDRAATLQAAGKERVHVLLQLDEVPDYAGRQRLWSEGIDLGFYVPDRAWIASLPIEEIDALMNHDAVRWMTPWDAGMKVHPRVAADEWPSWALAPSHPGWVMTFVQLHHDVAVESGSALAAAHGGVAGAPVVGLHGMTVWIERDNISALASEEDVLWIEWGPPPMSETNDGARAIMGVDTVLQAPYDLDGTGVRPLVYDGGRVRDTHETFDPGSGSRVTLIDSASLSDHATHVAGTLGGDGMPTSSGGRARGMATGTSIISAGFQWNGVGIFFWDNAGDIEADYALARNTHSADQATNSIGSNAASNGFPCSIDGDYGVASQLVDGIMRGDNGAVGSEYVVTWAAGNERTGGSPSGRCGASYYTTAPPGCAKNPIHVGANYSDGDAMTNFSSWGPCDDGRLKPIVGGPGCETARVTGEGGIYSSTGTSDTAYSSGFCGTSMSTPAVAGVVSLFIEDWRAQGHGGANDRPLPALVKALLMQTVRDRGQDGPDYMFGYGTVDAPAFIDFMRVGAALGGGTASIAWGTDSIDQGQTDTFTMTVPAGATELKASLAWDDAAAAPLSLPNLVNDLTLELEAPNASVSHPFVLDPANPHLDATTGVNTLDNQEQVVVQDPMPGTWTVRVIGTTVPTGPQTYALAYAGTSDPEGPCTEQIANGGFETDTSGWVLSGGAIRDAAPAAGHGSFSLRLIGNGASVEEAYTEVTVPTESDTAKLIYSWYMSSTTDPSVHQADYLWVEVRDTADNVLEVYDRLSADFARDDWYEMGNVDLSPWAGQTVRVTFATHTTNGGLTTFWVDDVSLSSCLGDQIFADGFESGDTSAWSATVP